MAQIMALSVVIQVNPPTLLSRAPGPQALPPAQVAGCFLKREASPLRTHRSRSLGASPHWKKIGGTHEAASVFTSPWISGCLSLALIRSCPYMLNRVGNWSNNLEIYIKNQVDQPCTPISGYVLSVWVMQITASVVHGCCWYGCCQSVWPHLSRLSPLTCTISSSLSHPVGLLCLHCLSCSCLSPPSLTITTLSWSTRGMRTAITWSWGLSLSSSPTCTSTTWWWTPPSATCSCPPTCTTKVAPSPPLTWLSLWAGCSSEF